jgi:hypothetical protein
METTTTWMEEIQRQLRAVAGALWTEVRETGVVPLLQPVQPYNRGLMAPLATVGGILGILLLSGIAITAMATAVVALLALWMLLARVFGFSIDVNPFAVRA